MAQRTKTHRGSKKLDNEHNKARIKIQTRKELETIEKDNIELTRLIEPEYYHEALNYL